MNEQKSSKESCLASVARAGRTSRVLSNSSDQRQPCSSCSCRATMRCLSRPSRAVYMAGAEWLQTKYGSSRT